MAGIHPWAEALHRDSLRAPKKAKPRFKCSSCPHRLTLNQAKASSGVCTHCRAPLKAHAQFQKQEAG